MSGEDKGQGVKRFAIMLSILAVVVGGAAAYVLFRSPVDDSAATTAATSEVNAKRLSYQQELNRQSIRFDPTRDMVVIDGRAYMRTDRPAIVGHCEMRCGTVESWMGTFAVRLPVGYVHDTNAADTKQLEPVDMLTFWNPFKRELETVRDNPTNKDGVLVPEFLREYRQLAHLQPGETAYTTADYVRSDCNGETYLFGTDLGYEQLGEEYGYGLDTAVTRRDDGSLAVRLPEGRKPLTCRQIAHDKLVPVTIVR